MVFMAVGQASDISFLEEAGIEMTLRGGSMW